MLPIDGPYAGGAAPRVRDYPVSHFAVATGTTQAPIWPSQNNAAAQPIASQNQMTRDTAGPDNQSQQSKSSDGGDVYLDGLLVGKWMSRFLQQQASRAQAGPTGFDSRRGRLLPGATVG